MKTGKPVLKETNLHYSRMLLEHMPSAYDIPFTLYDQLSKHYHVGVGIDFIETVQQSYNRRGIENILERELYEH